MNELQLYSVHQAASRLSISHWSVRAFIKAGKLHPIRLGRRVLLDETELRRFIAEARRASTETPCKEENDEK